MEWGVGDNNQGKCERQIRLQWRTWGHWRTGAGDGRLREQGGNGKEGLTSPIPIPTLSS